MKLRWLFLGLLLVALMVPALMITASRLLPLEGGRWVRLASFTPYAAVLYACALALTLLAIAATRGAWCKASGYLVLLVVPLLALHAFWLSSLYAGQQAAAADGPTLTVMAANLSAGEADPARVVQVAVRNDADLLVLSEITPAALARMDAAGLSRAYPHSEGATAPHVAGTMVFSTSELVDMEPLPTTFGGYTMTVEAEPVGRVRLLAVHPHPPLGAAADWKRDHAVVRDRLVEARAASGDPVLVVGDLNATPDHRPMRRLADLGLRNAAEVANSGFQPTWPAAKEVTRFGVAVPSMLQIDHVLLTDDLVATHTETLTINGTDHRALIAKVSRR